MFHCPLPVGMTEALREELMVIRREAWDVKIANLREQIEEGFFDKSYARTPFTMDWRERDTWRAAAAEIGCLELLDNPRPQLLMLPYTVFPAKFVDQVRHVLMDDMPTFLMLDTYPRKMHYPHQEPMTLKLNFALAGGGLVTWHEPDGKIIDMQRRTRVGGASLFDGRPWHTVWNNTDDTRTTLMVKRTPHADFGPFEDAARILAARATEPFSL